MVRRQYFIRNPREEHDVGLDALCVEDAGRQSKDGVKVAVNHQEAAQFCPCAVTEQDIVRHDDGAAATGFQGTNDVFQERHGADTFTCRDREVRPVHVARHFVEGRVGKDQVRLAHVFALWGAAVFAAHKTFDPV